MRDQEVAVHLAWKSTLYVTNFPESADDAFMRDLFGAVSAAMVVDVNDFSSSLVWDYFRRPMAKQEI